MFRTALLMLPLIGATLIMSQPADARRRIVGSDDADDEDKIDEEAEAKERNKREEKKKKNKEAAKEKSAEKEKKRAERKAAKKAAKEAAKKAAADKKEAVEAKGRQVVEKEKARLEGNKEARLLAAKKQRKLSRRSGDLVFTITMIPGAPAPGDVLELRVDTFKELAVADVKFGKFKPQERVQMAAEVSPPETGQDEEARTFRVHRLSSPGSYGFHVTPGKEGQHGLSITGKSDDDTPFTVDVALHVGVWPPPDFDGEEQNNAKQKATGSSGRRIVGGK